jgi:flagellar biosynthetic protein FliR
MEDLQFIQGEAGVAYVYILLRTLGMLLVVLSIGGSSVGHTARVGLAFVVVFSLIDRRTSPVLTWSTISAAAELGLGLMLGLPSILVLQASRMWGEMFDTGRGQSLGAMYDPLSGTSSQVMSQCIGSWVTAALLLMGLLPNLILSLASSLLLIAPGTVTVQRIASLASVILNTVGTSLTFGMMIYLPLGLSFLIVDIFGGFVSRLLPRFAIHAESFAARTVVGFAVLAGSATQGIHWSIFHLCTDPVRGVIEHLSSVP